MGEVNAGAVMHAAVLDLLDRDAQVRQTQVVAAWPLAIGRALDNDLVLGDPHVAAHHLRIEAEQNGLTLVVGDTANGVLLGARRLRAGERRRLDDHGAPVELSLGRTRLRLRLPGHTLEPERPLSAAAASGERLAPMLVVAAVLLAVLLFETWLINDPDELGAALGSLAVAAVLSTALWCGAWALLTKIITRRSRITWHLKVFMVAAIAWAIGDALPALLAFVFSWPAVADFGFVARYAVGAAALYFHLLAIEASRPRLMRAVAVMAWCTAVGLSLWFNQQREDRFGEELYLSHLFPPALRLARPVAPETFVDAMAPLQTVLDRKTQEASHGKPGSSDAD